MLSGARSRNAAASMPIGTARPNTMRRITYESIVRDPLSGEEATRGEQATQIQFGASAMTGGGAGGMRIRQRCVIVAKRIAIGGSQLAEDTFHRGELRVVV